MTKTESVINSAAKDDVFCQRRVAIVDDITSLKSKLSALHQIPCSDKETSTLKMIVTLLDTVLIETVCQVRDRREANHYAQIRSGK